MKKSKFSSTYDTDDKETFISLLMIRFIIFALVISMLMPKTEKSEETETSKASIRIEITWERGKNTDIDLWVQGPGDKPVGYSNTHGKVFDLVKDDIGSDNPTENHYEIVFARNAPAGDYTVNVVWYADRVPGGYKEAPVDVNVTYIRGNTAHGAKTQLLKKTVYLQHVGQEITAIRFSLDENGNVITHKTTTIYKPLFKKEK